MRIYVDRDRCQGHLRCAAVAPDLFEVDELGYSSEIGDGTVPTQLEDKARLAAANCPEQAVEILDE